MANSYGWATPTKITTGKGGGSNDPYGMSTDMGMGRDIYGEQMGPGKNDPKPVPPWQMPQQGGNQALDDWNRRFGSGSPVNYADENARNMAEGYSNYFAIPYLNAQMADRTQTFNEYNTGRNFDEQVRLNNSQMNLAERGSTREDMALKYGQENNIRDFGEAQRQYDAKLQLDTMLANGQIRMQDYNAETQRLGIKNDFALGQAKNANDALSIGNQYKLGMQNDSTNRYGMQLQDKQGMRTDATNRYGIDQTFETNKMQDATNRFGLSNQYNLGMANNATNRYGMDLQNSQQVRTDLTNRYGIDQNTGVAREQNQNTRYGMDLQNQQYNRGDATNRYGIDAQTQQGIRTDATNRYGMNQQYSLGLGQNANQDFANRALAQRYGGQTQNEAVANQNALQNIQNQYALGQGGLSFQNRELDTNEAYRRSQLSQEADLTREKFKNDLIQSRYSTFGRAAAPNARSLRSWY